MIAEAATSGDVYIVGFSVVATFLFFGLALNRFVTAAKREILKAIKEKKKPED